jgi:hypothetical protein
MWQERSAAIHFFMLTTELHYTQASLRVAVSHIGGTIRSNLIPEIILNA